ncbi:MAG: hypothetical protein QM669_13910 [Siphonobacter sp.]
MKLLLRSFVFLALTALSGCRATNDDATKNELEYLYQEWKLSIEESAVDKLVFRTTNYVFPTSDYRLTYSFTQSAAVVTVKSGTKTVNVTGSYTTEVSGNSLEKLSVTYKAPNQSQTTTSYDVQIIAQDVLIVKPL